MPERSPVILTDQERFLYGARPYVSLCKLVYRQPVKLQMVFPAHRLGVGDSDLKDEIEFVAGGVVFDVAVLDDADAPDDLGFGAEFFRDLAHQRYLNAFAGLDVAARQEQPRLRTLTGEKELTASPNDGSSLF